ncbi:MAG: tetratricopeptide repeat protein [Bacteroidales bacterium]|nr:tetratricopeptide repeat protein [Bacteroidales bacterium]
MVKRILYLLTFCTSVLYFTVVNAQIDKVLQPVNINPPQPPLSNQAEQNQSNEQLASQYFQNKEYDKAAVLYEKLFEKNPGSFYYTYYLFCLIELRDYSKAEKIVKKQIKNFPSRLNYVVDLGYVYSESGDLNKAEKQYKNAIDDIPADKSQIIELANAFLVRGQTEFAIETYRKGSQLLRNYPFCLEMGDLYRQTGNYSEMVEEYLNYLDFDYNQMPLVQRKLQNMMDDDQDNKIGENLRISLLKRVQKEPNKLYYSEMLLWQSIQDKNFVLAFTQAKSIDRRNNENGERLMELAELSLSNHNFDVAIDAFDYVLKKGKNNYLYIDARIGILTARYMKITYSYDYSKSDLTDLENDYQSLLDEYGRNASTIRVMQYLGHLQGFYLDKTEESKDILYEAINIPNAREDMVAECKIELADILLFIGEVWEAKLLYAQVEKAFKNEPIGHLAKFKNAKLSFYIGEFDWAKAQLDVLKAATSKLIANDALKFSVLISDNIGQDSSTVALAMYARADLLLFRNKDMEALATLDSIFSLATWHPIFDEVLLKKAEIKIMEREYDTAAAYLKEVVEEYPYDVTADDALFLLAWITDKYFLDSQKAMQLYQQLLEEYPGSLYTVDARKRFRYLRGDADFDNRYPEVIFFYDLKL